MKYIALNCLCVAMYGLQPVVGWGCVCWSEEEWEHWQCPCLWEHRMESVVTSPALPPTTGWNMFHQQQHIETVSE